MCYVHYANTTRRMSKGALNYPKARDEIKAAR